jgi:hypothetical protein
MSFRAASISSGVNLPSIISGRLSAAWCLFVTMLSHRGRLLALNQSSAIIVRLSAAKARTAEFQNAEPQLTRADN